MTTHGLSWVSLVTETSVLFSGLLLLLKRQPLEQSGEDGGIVGRKTGWVRRSFVCISEGSKFSFKL